MVGLVRGDETREALGILRPVEVAAVDDAAADLRRVAVHVLRRRVRHDVAAEVERTAQHRGRERVVHDQRHAELVRRLRELRNVEHHAGRIRDRLAEHALGVRAERLRDLRRRRVRAHERKVDAQLLQRDREEVEGAAVDLRRTDNVVARVAEVEDRVRRGRLARTREDRGHAALERADLLRDLVVRRVRKARVEVAALLQVEEVGHLLARLVLESGRGVDRHLPRLALLRLPSTLNAKCVNGHCFAPF